MVATTPRIKLFGELNVQLGERVVDRFRTQRTAELLAYLAYHAGHAHQRDELAERFWPESDGAAARNNVSVALSSLRNLLAVPGTPGQMVVVADRQTVALKAELIQTDVAEFQSHRRAAPSTSALERLTRLQAACELYRGPLLTGFHEPWVLAERQVQRAALTSMVDEAVELCLRGGDLPRAISLLREAVEADPDVGALHLGLAKLLAGAGRQGDAVAHLEAVEARREANGLDLRDPALSELLDELRSNVATAAPRPLDIPAAPSPLTPGPELIGTLTLALVRADDVTDPDEQARWQTLGEARHGRAIPWGADTLALAFGRGTDAAEYAVELTRTATEAGDELLPRLALHTGEVLVDDQQGNGASATDPMQRLRDFATRLVLAANPGQVVCSDTTAALLSRELRPELWLKQLGLYRLQERGRPDRVHQLCAADLAPNSFPPLLAPTGFENHLPHLLTRFHGRLQEQQDVESRILDDHARLVTLTGLGGAGKTRLSIEVGRRLLDAFQGAVWFVPLADLRDPSRILGAVRESLGIELTVASRPEEEVLEFLRRQPCLLLLDNFEQLAEAGTGVVEKLLSDVPTLTCLVTSRQVLGLPGECEYALPPLTLPDEPFVLDEVAKVASVRLFVDRAQEARAGFRLTEDNFAAVARLCCRLEGLPLGIELAAARAQVLAPAQLLERIDRALDFLVSRQRNVPDRHRTLRAALDWSHELLTPELQRAFASLSVLSGSWSLEAAEAVTDDPFLIDAIAELRGASLLVVDEGPEARYRMLQTVRTYAAERLDTSDGKGLRRRHFEYYVALAARAGAALDKDDNSWLTVLDTEQDNLRSAFEFGLQEEPQQALQMAGSLWRYWLIRGHWDEARRTLAAALDAAVDAPGDLKAKSLGWLGHLAFRQADYHAAQGYLEQGLALCRELDCPSGVGNALNELGKIAWALGDHETAQRQYEESLAIRRQSGNDWSIAASLANLGSLAANAGDLGAASAYLEESLAIRRRLGDERGAAGSLNNLGIVRRAQGDYADATRHLEESLAIRRRLNDQQGMAASLSDLGVVAQEQANCQAAKAFHEESLAIRRGLGDRRGMAASLNNLGVLSLSLGDFSAAQRYYRESMEVRREIGDKRGLALALNNLGDVAASVGDWDKSRPLYHESLALQFELGDPVGAGLALLNLALTELGLHEPRRALMLFTEVECLLDDRHAPWLRGYLHHGIARAMLATGQTADAWQRLQQALAAHAHCDDRAGLLDGLETGAALLLEHGEPQAAFEVLAEVDALRDGLGLVRLPAAAANYRLLVHAVSQRLGPEHRVDARENDAAPDWDRLLSRFRQPAEATS